MVLSIAHLSPLLLQAQLRSIIYKLLLHKSWAEYSRLSAFSTRFNIETYLLSCIVSSDGKITAFCSPSSVRLYDVSNITEPSSSPSSSIVTSRTLPPPNPTGYIYARVSSAKQKAEPERQKQLLLNKYPQYELISDVGSGINFKQAGLRSLLERSRRGLVKEVTFFFFFFL